MDFSVPSFDSITKLDGTLRSGLRADASPNNDLRGSSLGSFALEPGFDSNTINFSLFTQAQKTKPVTQKNDELSSFLYGMKYGARGAQTLLSPLRYYKAAKTQKNIYGLQAQMYEMEQDSYNRAAEDVLRAGQQQVASTTFQFGQAKASTRASQGASGTRIGSGSNARVLATYDIAKQTQVNQIMANVVAQSWGYRMKAVSAKGNALAARAAADSISPWAAAIVGGAKSAVGLFSSAYDDFGAKDQNGNVGGFGQFGKNFTQGLGF